MISVKTCALAVSFIALITEKAALSIIRPHTGCRIVQWCTLADLHYFKSPAAKVTFHVVEIEKKLMLPAFFFHQCIFCAM